MNFSVAVDRYDPYDGAVHTYYPASLYTWMRNDAPLCRSDRHDFWALSRFADVQEASRDWETFSSAGARGVDLDGTSAAVYGGAGNFLEMDPPRHDTLRGVVRRRFDPRPIGALEATLRAETCSLVAHLRASGGGDIAQSVCWQLASNVLARFLGLPRADHARVSDLVSALFVREPGSTTIPALAVDAGAELRAYLGALLTDRTTLGEGVLQDLAIAVDSDQLTQSEAIGTVMLLFGASVETPAAFVANAIYLLAEDADQRELITRKEVSVSAAVEELLRIQSPVQCLARTTTRSVVLHDTELPSGSTVMLVYGAANRDERRWDDPDALLLGRRSQRNLAFGEGLHHCLGAPLTRLEAKCVLEVLLAEAPQYAVAGPVRRLTKYSDWGILNLPVEL
jgi:cytochrome P450